MDHLPELTAETPRRQGRKALWFTLVPLLALALLLAAAASRQHWFAASDRLYAFADSSAGIAVGMPVKLQGFIVGTVRDMALVPPEGGQAPRVRLALEVGREHLAYIGRDARLRLSRDGLIGQPILEIVPGDPRARRAAEGDVLAFERPRTLNEIADGMEAKAAPLLSGASELFQRLKDPDGDLMHSLARARQIVEHVDDTTQAVGSLARRSESVVASAGGEAARTLATAGRILERTEQAMPKVEGVVDNLAAATRSVAGIAQRAEGVVDESGQLVGEAGRMVDGAQHAWPFSLWLRQDGPAAVAIDSQDNGKSFITPRNMKSPP